MATNKKINECGWFYHAPAKRQQAEPVPVPVASQIPGLNYELPYEEEETRSLFKDTDTKYVRLAKSGGRQNLLHFKENPNMRERETVSYPRNEWFYLEDNRLEDAEQKKEDDQYTFSVPEYMYHEVFVPDTQSETYERPRRAPYSFDNISAYEREGKSLTDKTVKLPEVVKPGYGVRSGKTIKTRRPPPPPAGLKTTQIPNAKMAAMDEGQPRLKYLPLPEASDKHDKAKMSKLLSYTYDKEWHDEVHKWQFKQERLREKHKQMIAAQGPQHIDPLASEYSTTIGKSRPPVYRPEKGRRVWETASNTSRSSAKTSNRDNKEKTEKEPFKMTKFKNIPSKVDTQMPKAMVAATN